MALPSFREVQQFRTDDPGQLSTQLSRFENNIAQQFQAVANVCTLTPTTIRASTSGNAFTSGQLLIADTAATALKAILTAGAVGFLFIVNNGSHTLTFEPASPAKVNGTSSVVLAANSFSKLFFDGANWWTA